MHKKINQINWVHTLVGLLALFVANVVWQVIDISSLQRLQSVEQEGKNREPLLRAIAYGGLESAGIWAVILMAGFSLFGLNIADTNNIFAPIIDVGMLGAVSVLLFTFSLTAFCLSTVDSFSSAISYVFYYDIFSSFFGKQTNEDDVVGEDTSNDLRSLNSARWQTLLIIVTIVVLYFGLRAGVGGANIAALLYAIYAIQLSIFPVVVFAIWNRNSSPVAGIISISLGWLVACVSAYAPPSFGIVADSWYVIPPLVVLIVSMVSYVTLSIVFGLFSKKI